MLTKEERSDDIRVEANGIGVFGGWTNQFGTANTSKPTLKIKGTAVFGEVEVKN